MSIQQFLLALRARFGVFGLALAATVLAATVTSLLLPKSYKATVSNGVAAGGREGRAIAQQRPPSSHCPAGAAQLPADTDGHHYQQESGAQSRARPEARGESFDADGLRARAGRQRRDRGLADREPRQEAQSGNLAEQRHPGQLFSRRPGLLGVGRQRVRQSLYRHDARVAGGTHAGSCEMVR